MDASMHGWAGVLTQEFKTEVKGKVLKELHPVAYISGLFCGSQLNWAALTKEAYAIYMSVKKLSFYITDVDITLRSDHLSPQMVPAQEHFKCKSEQLGSWAGNIQDQV